MDKLKININEMLESISNAQDLVSPRLSNHHQQVAYLAFRLAEHIGLPFEQQKDVYLAGLLHDIGALSTPERLELLESEPVNVHYHGFSGAKLLEGFMPLKEPAYIIKYHHLRGIMEKGAPSTMKKCQLQAISYTWQTARAHRSVPGKM